MLEARTLNMYNYTTGVIVYLSVTLINNKNGPRPPPTYKISIKQVIQIT